MITHIKVTAGGDKPVIINMDLVEAVWGYDGGTVFSLQSGKTISIPDTNRVIFDYIDSQSTVCDLSEVQS